MDTSSACYSKDGSVNEKHAVVQWGKVWQEAGKRSGHSFDLLEQNLMEEGMKAAGFTNIVSKDYAVSCPIFHCVMKASSPPHMEKCSRRKIESRRIVLLQETYL